MVPRLSPHAPQRYSVWGLLWTFVERDDELARVRASKPHPSDVADEEWVFIVPYLMPVPEDVSRRREVRLTRSSV